MKKRIVFIFFTSSIFLYCCTATKYVSTPPAAPELTAAQKRWPDATAQDMERGHTIYTTRCITCHKLYAPAGFSEKKWEHEITDMAPKAKLNAEEKEALRKYILAAMDAGKKQN